MPRIVTYNVHNCVGVDRRLDVGRVAGVIAALEPDIVALQEVDVGRARSGGVDQAHEIARRLDMACHFNAALRVEEEQYGDAILTSLPERLVKAGPLPGLRPTLGLEPRGALWVAVALDGVELQVINTHLGLVAREQQKQAAALAGSDWLRHADCKGPTVLLGDFNATFASVVYRTLTARLQDARRMDPASRRTATFPSRFPLLRIDHVFVSGGVHVTAVDAPLNAATRLASDHLPLVMDFTLAA
ncbi:MAG: endonuclease/exonuclease/phosphatase family protein [Caulobacteraceae bacterium]|nr:endonuclease/exonuclease/phosphatase family protein [Caulobacteraceae bacterium]